MPMHHAVVNALQTTLGGCSSLSILCFFIVNNLTCYFILVPMSKPKSAWMLMMVFLSIVEDEAAIV